jgi:hypothetical protein
MEFGVNLCRMTPRAPRALGPKLRLLPRTMGFGRFFCCETALRTRLSTQNPVNRAICALPFAEMR